MKGSVLWLCISYGATNCFYFVVSTASAHEFHLLYCCAFESVGRLSASSFISIVLFFNFLSLINYFFSVPWFFCPFSLWLFSSTFLLFVFLLTLWRNSIVRSQLLHRVPLSKHWNQLWGAPIIILQKLAFQLQILLKLWNWV